MSKETAALAKAAAIYRREWCARTFSEDLALHLRGGFVISTPGVMLWFRGVRAEAAEHEICDPVVTWPEGQWTGWMVALLATSGPCDWKAIKACFPRPLPLLFQKRNRLIRRSWAIMERHTRA